jgi:hypothetical protein
MDFDDDQKDKEKLIIFDDFINLIHVYNNNFIVISTLTINLHV